MDDFLTVVGSIVLIAGIILILPFISFWCAYFGGWITKITIGDQIVSALNIIFNTTYFTKNMIPMMAGGLGWIGSFFKNVQRVKK